jgi:putative peptidoglycan binding protein
MLRMAAQLRLSGTGLVRRIAMRIATWGILAAAVLLSACGTNTTQRSSTGLLTGAGVGALVGGPIGALVGAAVGAAGGAAIPEGADTIAANALHQQRIAGRGWLNDAGLASGSSSPVASGSTQARNEAVRQEPSAEHRTPQRTNDASLIKNAQDELAREGLYDGGIDGIVGPKTKRATADFQDKAGLRKTSRLDDATLAALWQQSLQRSASEPNEKR